MPTSRNSTSDGVLGDVKDLWDLVVAYFRQETLEPIKGLGRFVGFGLAGSAVLGIGLVLFLLGILRLLQAETGDVFAGHLSFVPYLVVLAGCAVAAFAAVRAASGSGGAAR